MSLFDWLSILMSPDAAPRLTLNPDHNFDDVVVPSSRRRARDRSCRVVIRSSRKWSARRGGDASTEDRTWRAAVSGLSGPFWPNRE
ncbi:hypothetical protein EVAR_67755_1 [Eumeta japonica]|uniref:Uncharacterized protein n=1 Tax=Eumeta variegata TaxID=151549 RepID=A0A4C1ZHU8_EUMVA|nr:hypothetical protein EVAR_67755_1 [Eumeta japonica]